MLVWVRGAVAKEKVAAGMAARLGFAEVAAVAVNVEYHITGDVMDGGIGVGGRIV